MRWKSAFVFLLLLTVTAFAQVHGNPLPDRCHAMVLDQTTPSEAIARFGGPEIAATLRLGTDPILHWITKRQHEMVFRSLVFKKPAPTVKRVWLSFLNGKRVLITLKSAGETLSANALPAVSGADFQPLRDSRGEVRSSHDFERRASGASPKSLPPVYHLAAVMKQRFVIALVGASSTHDTALTTSASVPERPDFFPGKVTLIESCRKCSLSDSFFGLEERQI
jgi:hypothetical protein